MTAPPDTLRADEPALVALMIAYQAGDLAAFEQLYATLVDDVRGYFARTHPAAGVAGDLAQDVFLELHRARRTYAPPLPVRPWVFGIARNVAARGRRAARARPQAHAPLDAERDELTRWGFVHLNTGTDWSKGERSDFPVTFIHDPINDGEGPRVFERLYTIFDTAKESIIIESPYLIPSQVLLELLGKKLDEGVKIRIVTNSMKSTDGILPQVAYLRYRSHLVRSGIEMFEFKGPDTLHSKSVIIDGKIAMVGSYNVDPRSQNLNTEVMCVAQDAESSRKLQDAIDVHIRNSWRIARNSRTPKSYPKVTRMMKFRIWTTKLLLPFIEGQL